MNTEPEIVLAKHMRVPQFFDRTKSLYENMLEIAAKHSHAFLPISSWYLNYALLSPYVSSKYIPKSIVDCVSNVCILHMEGGFVVPKTDYDGDNIHLDEENFKHLSYVFRKNDLLPFEHYAAHFHRVIAETVDRHVYFTIFCDKRMPNYVNFPTENMTIRSHNPHGSLIVSFFFHMEFFFRLFRVERFPFEFANFCRQNQVQYIMLHHLPITDIHPKVIYHIHIQNGMEHEETELIIMMFSGADETLPGTNINTRHHFHTFRSFKRLFYALKFRTKLRDWAYRAIDRLSREKYSPVKLQELVDTVRDDPNPEEALQTLLEKW